MKSQKRLTKKITLDLWRKLLGSQSRQFLPGTTVDQFSLAYSVQTESGHTQTVIEGSRVIRRLQEWGWLDEYQRVTHTGYREEL